MKGFFGGAYKFLVFGNVYVQVGGILDRSVLDSFEVSQWQDEVRGGVGII